MSNEDPADEPLDEAPPRVDEVDCPELWKFLLLADEGPSLFFEAALFLALKVRPLELPEVFRPPRPRHPERPRYLFVLKSQKEVNLSVAIKKMITIQCHSSVVNSYGSNPIQYLKLL